MSTRATEERDLGTFVDGGPPDDVPLTCRRPSQSSEARCNVDPLEYEGGRIIEHSSATWTAVTGALTVVWVQGGMLVTLGSDVATVSFILEAGGGRVEMDAPIPHVGCAIGARRTIGFVPAGCVMRARATNVRRLRHLVLRFSSTRMSELLDEPVDLGSPFLRACVLGDVTVESLCKLFAAECDTGQNSGRLYGDSLSVALVLRLVELARAGTKIPVAGLAPWQLRRVVSFLDAHFARDVSLQELARSVRLSPSHFSRAFKRSTGVSPYRWLVDLRCAKAKQLLSDKGLGLAEVAVATGFSDQSHFTRVFARSAGVPPGAWRRANGLEESGLGRSATSA